MKSFKLKQYARICNEHFLEAKVDESFELKKKKLVPNSREPYLKKVLFNSKY